jgi:hypothetical protein
MQVEGDIAYKSILVGQWKNGQVFPNRFQVFKAIADVNSLFILLSPLICISLTQLSGLYLRARARARTHTRTHARIYLTQAPHKIMSIFKFKYLLNVIRHNSRTDRDF